LDPPEALADAVDAVLSGWVERSVARIVTAYRGGEPPEVACAAQEAGRAAVDDIGGVLRRLLAQDVDDQRANPLSIVRGAVRYPTAVLRDAGVPEVVRDDFRVRAFPDDVYDLSPASWQDVDPSLHEPGLIWGAWKAKTVLDRRRAEGRR
jgi:hypothetical protein